MVTYHKVKYCSIRHTNDVLSVVLVAVKKEIVCEEIHDRWL